MTFEQPLRPGWYRMSDGRAQWWDGRSWSTTPAPPEAVPPAPGTSLASQPGPAGRQPGSPAGVQPIPAQLAPAPYAHAPAVVHHVHVPQKDVGIAYLFALLLGSLGAHRFYLGKPGSAVAMLLLWFFGAALTVLVIGIPILFAVFVWWIVDLCLLPGMVREANVRGVHGSVAALG